METPGRPWALVLAAGEGSRLRSLTTDIEGNWTPKQFCALGGGDSLLGMALRRAARVARRGRVTTIVAEQHEVWWRRELALLPERNVVVQPRNRGTAPGILLPLLRILEHDPSARIALLPSDHYVADEDALARTVGEALDVVARTPERVALLGVVPDRPDTGLGWIVPGPLDEHGVPRVERFVEKPPAPLAVELMGRGAVWNTFILAGTGKTLLGLFEERLPDTVDLLRRVLASSSDARQRASMLSRAYEDVECRDFSRDILEGFADRLVVLPAARCGWTDLGTPERVMRCLERMPAFERARPKREIVRLDTSPGSPPLQVARA